MQAPARRAICGSGAPPPQCESRPDARPSCARRHPGPTAARHKRPCATPARFVGPQAIGREGAATARALTTSHAQTGWQGGRLPPQLRRFATLTAMPYTIPMSLRAPVLASAVAPSARAAAPTSSPPAPHTPPWSCRYHSGTSRSSASSPQVRCRRRRVLPPAAAQQQPGDGSPEALATEFSAFLNEHSVPELLRDRRPTHLMSPMACIAAQLGALQVGGADAEKSRLSFATPSSCQPCTCGSCTLWKHLHTSAQLLWSTAWHPGCCGKHMCNNCFPAPSLLRSITTGRSRMRVCRRPSCSACRRVPRSCWQRRCSRGLGSVLTLAAVSLCAPACLGGLLI